jgi:hypothetical protein
MPRDNNRWIKEQAVKLLGPFLECLKGTKKANLLLLDEYLKLSTPALKEIFPENNEVQY